MSTNPPPVPPMPPPGPVKKTNPLVWILGGVGGCLVLVIIVVGCFTFFVAYKAKQAGLDGDLMRKNPALAAAKIAIAVNPNLEMVSVDENRGEITVRDKKTGKVSSMTFEDAKNGKYTWREDGRTVTFGGRAKIPTWVPDYPGSDPRASVSARGDGEESGGFTFKTSDGGDKVLRFYEDQFKASGMKITKNVTSEDGRGSAGMLHGTDESGRRSINAVIAGEAGDTSVVITYQTNK
jgi:hypothetical protein